MLKILQVFEIVIKEQTIFVSICRPFSALAPIVFQ
jgi:hypothetical protein